jgi:hypothetical protein
MQNAWATEAGDAYYMGTGYTVQQVTDADEAWMVEQYVLGRETQRIVAAIKPNLIILPEPTEQDIVLFFNELPGTLGTEQDADFNPFDRE